MFLVVSQKLVLKPHNRCSHLKSQDSRDISLPLLIFLFSLHSCSLLCKIKAKKIKNHKARRRNMSTRASMELDFFGMEKGNSSSKSQFQMLLEQRRNVRGVQNTISKLNPQFLKSMIDCSGIPTPACVELGNLLLPVNVVDGFMKKEVVTPPNDLLLLGMENIPVFKNPISRVAATTETTDPGTLNAPLTIFYNGTVCVFDLPHDKAEMIMKLAEDVKSLKIVESAPPEPNLFTDSSSTTKQDQLVKLNEYLPKPVAASSGSNGQQELLLEKLNGDLPIARKKSLQRFLAKRKERLTTISPYGRGGSEYAVEKKQLQIQE